MTNQPLSSEEQGKLLLFALLFAPTIIFLVGIIPAIFLGFGIFMMKRNQDFSSVETAVRYFKVYCWIGIGVSLLWIVNQSMYTIVKISIPVLFPAYLVFVQVLFFNPLKSHSEWISVNGIFSSKPKSAMPISTGAEVDIIKGEKLKQYSVADELIKWAKLKEDGHITEEEFDEARTKLLKRS